MSNSHDNAIVYTLAHEFVHFSKKWSPKEYRVFTDFMVEQFAEHGKSLDELVRQKMGEIGTNDYDYAFEEVVADACERMLLDSNAMEKLALLKKKSPNVFEKFMQHIKELLEKLKLLHADTHTTNDYSAALHEMTDVLEKFYELFENMAVDAVRNFEASSEAKNNDNINKHSKKKDVNDKFGEYSIQVALWDALDHKDNGDDNLIRVSEMPSYIVDKLGVDGDFYIYRDHAYENMVTKERAIQDGRPIKRNGENIHFHGFDVEKMTNAMLSINCPTMTISTKTKDGNPAVIMLLDEFGFNNAPLYAVLSFYSNRPINGRLDRKPHIVFTVAEREYVGTEGRAGYEEIIKNAIKDGRVLDYNIKKRDDLSVIAESAGLGNITKSSLENNLSRFKKDVKSFREKYKISYQKKKTSNRVILADTLESTIDTSTQEGKNELTMLQKYQTDIAKIEKLESRLAEVSAELKEISFSKGKRDVKRQRELTEEKTKLVNRIDIYDRRLLKYEATKPIKDLLARKKEQIRKQYRAEGSERVRVALNRKNDSIRLKKEKENLQKLVLETTVWLTKPKKGEIPCPDIIKEPFADFHEVSVDYLLGRTENPFLIK